MRPELALLHVHGDGASKIGYGRLGIKLADALRGMGVEVFNGIEAPEATIGHLQQQENDYRARTNVACWVSTPSHARGWLDGQHLAIFTMFETNRLPEAFRENLHNFATVIVPSAQNVEMFSQYHDNVRYVPLAVDVNDWHYTPRPSVEREFRFLCGGSGPRKGTDLVVDAFKQVFKTWPKDGPVPRLVMKNPKGEDIYGDRIEVVAGRLTDEEERALYASCHVYVQPSRGEGWGLQPLQAMAQGMPTILTDAHGHAAFSHLGYGVSSELAQSGYFIYGDAGEWWEPDFGELCERMWHCYTQWDEAEQVGRDAAAGVAGTFTWDATAAAFIDAIGKDNLTVPYQGDGTWRLPESKLYPVRVLRTWRADIAGSVFIFEQGNTYYENADVARLLFESDILDPSCLSIEDNGLLPEQVAQAGAYSAKNSYCPSCSQKLNSGVTKADEIMAEMADADHAS